jgi:hypothetical protein
MTTAAPARPSALARWAALGGVTYVVLFILGVIVIDSGAPDVDAPPNEVIAYWSDGGNRDQAGLGYLLMVTAVFFLLCFVAALRQLLRRIDADGLLTGLATIGGAVYGGLTLAGAGLQAGLLTMSGDSYQDQVFPELIQAAREAGYWLHSAGGVGAAALIVASTLAASRARLLPAWAAAIGVIIGVLAIFSVFFVPQLLIALWVLVASALLFRAVSGPREALPGPD